MSKFAFRRGARVHTTHTGFVGRVHKRYSSFRTTRHDSQWLSQLTVPLSTAELRVPWYFILVDGGGAVLVPETRCEVLVVTGETSFRKQEITKITPSSPDHPQSTASRRVHSET